MVGSIITLFARSKKSAAFRLQLFFPAKIFAMSNEVTLRLSSQPNNDKAEFLATLEPIAGTESSSNGQSQHEDDLPFEIILDAYTRDDWTLQTAHIGFHSVWMKSTDGRHRLPGFLTYLKERKKAAYSMFTSPRPDPLTGKTLFKGSVFWIPHEQPPLPTDFDSGNSDTFIFIQYCLKVKGGECVFKHQAEKEGPNASTSSIAQSNSNELQKKIIPEEKTKMNTTKTKTNKHGFLGNLVSKQERTQHIISTVVSSHEKNDTEITTSAQGILQSFQCEVEQKLIHFQSSSNQSLLIPICLAHYVRKISPSANKYLEQVSKITLDVLKFIVYEQVEQVLGDDYVAIVTDSTTNDPESVTATDSGMYLDEIMIRVYKPGCAPQQVLDELNTGQAPEEVRRQNQQIRETRLKEQKKRNREEERIQTKRQCIETANRDDRELESLDKKKRDRRTIEEIMANNHK